MNFQRMLCASVLFAAFVFLGGATADFQPIFAQNSAVAPLTGPASSELEPLHATVTAFFENISDTAAGPQKGLVELLKNSPLGGEEKEKIIASLANSIQEIYRRFGAYLSFEPIGVKSIGRDLVVLRYLYKCQDYPVVWYFTFYRPTSGVTGTASPRSLSLIHFYYDSNLNIQSWESGF